MLLFFVVFSDGISVHWLIFDHVFSFCFYLGCGGIHLAAQFGHTAIVAYFIAKGQDVDMRDRNGMTPLMWAAFRVFG